MPRWSKTYATFIILSLLAQYLSGQSDKRPPCGQSYFEKKNSAIMPESLQGQAPFLIQNRTQLVVPVVIHVVWKAEHENISDALISSQIDALNRDYNALNEDLEYVPDEFETSIASIGISFCLASETPTGQQTNGILRVKSRVTEVGISDSLFFDATGGSSAWNTEKYLNIWVANTGNLISGYGTYPGLTPKEKTGVVINPKYFGLNEDPKYGQGRTLVHEVGHYFGLKHVWSNDPLCEKDDGVDDTPKQKYEHSGCPNYPQPSCTESDMFMNFMDYVDDPCMLLFTKGQKEKIWANIELYRPFLLSNNVEYYCLQPNLKSDLVFTIFPNPATDIVTVAFSEQKNSITEVQVFDMLGRLRMHIKTLANQKFEFETNGLEPGMYFVKICEKACILIKQ